MVLFSGCVEKQYFFPTQKETVTTYMDALLGGRLVVDDGGCLRVNGYLLVWPYRFSLSTFNDMKELQILDNDGKYVTQLGHNIRVSGGEISGDDSGNVSAYSTQLPSDRCMGPYWIVGNEIAEVEEKPKQITEPQAIAIANATEEAQEFLKLYPDAKTNVVSIPSMTPPTSLGIIALDNGSIRLNWSAPLGGPVAQYNIYRTTNTGDTYGHDFFSASPYTAINGTEFIDNKVTIGTDYFYIIRAEDVKGNIETNLNEVTATSASGAPVSNLTATTLSNGHIELNWNCVNDSNVLQYLIYRATYRGGQDFFGGPHGITINTTYIDTYVTHGEQYYYVVVPIYTNGMIGYNTNEVGITSLNYSKILASFGTEWYDMIWQVEDKEVKCSKRIDKLTWVVVYHKTDAWKSPNAVAVKIGIDAETGEIIAKSPKLEYIKDSTYCEKDEDCRISIKNCSCNNYYNDIRPPIKLVIRCDEEGICMTVPLPQEENCDFRELRISCKCVNNTCASGENPP